MPDIKIETIEIDLCGAALTQSTLDRIYGLAQTARDEGAQGITITIKRITPLMMPRLIADYGDRIHLLLDYVEKQMEKDDATKIKVPG